MSVIQCLASFLSGTLADVDFAKQMLATLNVWGVARHMKDCFQMQQAEYETRVINTRSYKKLVKTSFNEGIAYCILMRQLKAFDTENLVIHPIITSEPSMIKAWSFFNAQCGYVEVVRHHQLEGILFQMPQDVGEELFDEMYETEREDIDKKNREWLTNLKNITYRVELHAEIRKGFWAFSVDYFSTITTLCLWLAFGIHTLCIVGNYRAADDYIALLVDNVRRKASSSSSDSSTDADPFLQEKTDQGDNPLLSVDTGFEPTEQDAYFFERVENPIRWIIRVMSWINLVLCVLRIASFVKAELPMVLHIGNAANEDEESEEVKVTEDADLDDELAVKFGLEFEIIATAYESECEDKHASSTVHANEHQHSNADSWKETRHTINIIFSSTRTLYETLYILFATLAVVYDEPLATTFSLFDICFWPGIRTVLDAFRFNARKMGETILLGLLCMCECLCARVHVCRRVCVCLRVYVCVCGWVFVCV